VSGRASAPLALALAVACGSSAGRVAPPPMSEGVVDEADGTRIVLVPRDTRERLWLSLWIDAGSRDAESPELPTVALAGALASPEIAVRTLLDGIELSRACRRPALRACLEELAATVGARQLDPDRWSDAQEQRRRARTRTLGDRARQLDSLALEALFGRSVDPVLGQGEAEPSRESAEAFLADHAGPGRLLLVAVGDVGSAELREAVRATLGQIPPARRPRTPRPEVGARAFRLEVGDRDATAAATLRPNIADAARLARRLVARVEADAPGVRSTADVFPVRGGAALIARVEGSRGRAALLDHLAELSEEPPLEASDPPPTEDGPRALAGWVGVRWASGQGSPARGGLGLGVLVDGGRADRVGEADPDAALRATAERQLEATLRSVGAPVPLSGTVSPDGVDARVPGGGRILGRRLPGAARLSAVVLFEGGAVEDTPEVHGITALLARLASESCEELARRELGQTLEALGIDAAWHVQADAWGLRVEGPPTRWREIAYLAPRCAAVPLLERLERARQPMMLGLRSSAQLGRAAAASLLSPTAPGRVAPFGSWQGLDAVTPRALARARGQRVARARARIAIAGDVAMDDAARILARGAARWDVGAAPELAPWAPSTEWLRGIRHPEDRHEAVIAWAAESPAATNAAAAAFAAAMGGALSSEPGLRTRWSEGGAQGGRAFALVGVEVTDPDVLDELPARVARASSAVEWDAVAARAVADGEERRAWAESSPRQVAMALAAEPEAPPSRDGAREALRRLAGGPARHVVLRPQPRRR
jgi:predicted Zn-dependent peptidase